MQPQPLDPPTTYAAPSQFNPAHWPPVSEQMQRPRKRGLTGLQLVAAAIFLTVGGLVVGLISGTTIGAANAPEKAPTSCIKALEHADTGFGIAADGMGYAADALGAAGRFSVSGLETAADGMEDEAEKMKALSPKYKAARESCNALK
jgi:hypothetical protein